MEAYKMGDKVTYYDIQDKDGHLYKPGNKTKVFIVWKTTCAYCKKIFAELLRKKKNYAQIDFVFVAIDHNVEAWKRKSLDYGLQNEINLIDFNEEYGKFFHAFNIQVYPTFLILDENDILRQKDEGNDVVDYVLKSAESIAAKGKK
jgi:thiol-disulfide isomerase/thioredoxin